MTDPRPALALNPLPWILDAHTGFHLDEPSLTAGFAAASSLGFTAVQADIPKGWSVARYVALRDAHGFDSAPGYFSAPFELELAPILEAAKAHAAGQAALGLTEVFIAGGIAAERRAVPAIGAHADAGRLDVVLDHLGEVAEAIRAEGLTPALHPHVGTWIETEQETRAALDRIPRDVLAFGPDTGHLAWVGADVAGVMADYRDRIVALHLKDVDVEAVRSATAAHAVYAEATTVHHVWTEPGRGSVDFDAVLAALPDGFRGWAVLEIDVPNIGDAAASTAESARWLRARAEFAGALR